MGSFRVAAGHEEVFGDVFGLFAGVDHDGFVEADFEGAVEEGEEAGGVEGVVVLGVGVDDEGGEGLVEVLDGVVGVVGGGEVDESEGSGGGAGGDEGFDESGHGVEGTEFEDGESGGQVAVEELGEEGEGALVDLVFEQEKYFKYLVGFEVKNQCLKTFRIQTAVR